MDTTRVDIAYRPLRIGWAIRSGDVDAFRRAVQFSYTLWGGRFNPILIVDREEEARRLVDLFRVDLILGVGDAEEVRDFPKGFAHLIKPFLFDGLYIGGPEGAKAVALDIHNLFVHLRDKPEWKAFKERGLRVYNWQAEDPLGDVFLVHFGAYPSATTIGIDYRAMLTNATGATDQSIEPNAPIGADTLEYPSIAYVSRHGLERHYSVRPGWDSPGFYVGDAADVDDLTCHWNLRAADIPLLFVDPKHMHRYAKIIPAWEGRMRQLVSHRRELDRRVAVWSRTENLEVVREPFADFNLLACPIDVHYWNGRNVRPPMMHLGQVSTLGVVGREGGSPRVSFTLNDKPFCGDTWFHTPSRCVRIIHRRPVRRRTAHSCSAVHTRTERIPRADDALPLRQTAH